MSKNIEPTPKSHFRHCDNAFRHRDTERSELEAIPPSKEGRLLHLRFAMTFDGFTLAMTLILAFLEYAQYFIIYEKMVLR